MILALGLAACSKVQDLTPEITPEESQEKEEVKASVLTFQTVSVDTKTVLSGKSINWLATDVIKIFNDEGEIGRVYHIGRKAKRHQCNVQRHAGGFFQVLRTFPL